MEKLLFTKKKKPVAGVDYEPDGIIINVPQDFLTRKGYTQEGLIKWYNGMNKDDRTFYHYIAHIPTVDVLHVYVCFGGKVQLKARKGAFLRDEVVMGDGPRHWVVTCGPVIIAPHEILQRGFQGFRYTSKLF